MKQIISIVLMLLSTQFSYGACYQVSVVINETKPNNSTWDSNGGLPDLKVCFSDEWGYRCKVKAKYQPYCKDTLNCDLGIVYFIGTSTEVELIDVDLKRNDPIGSKTCDVGGSCNLGNATVNFSEALCT